MVDPAAEATPVSPSREATLINAFVALTDALTDTYDATDLLHSLLVQCTRLVDVDAGGILILDSGGTLQLLASTSENTDFVEIMQIDAGSGPCIDCFESGRPVVVEDIADNDGRWPEFRSAALRMGFRSVHAVPMTLRGETIGAMNLFRTRIGALGPLDASLAQALAAVATLGILHERTVRESSIIAAQLQRALDSRILIEQAKGVLATSTATGIDDAFAAMRAYARSNNISIRSVARQVIDHTVDIPVPAPGGRLGSVGHRGTGRPGHTPG